MVITIYKNSSVQIPGYKRELRDGVCKLGMGEGQESERRQLRLILNSTEFDKLYIKSQHIYLNIFSVLMVKSGIKQHV